ncbi:MAG: 2OG-Fe(II) oxygenase [Gammaproteobacteria bacterium]|nr:2OG-Fe(II) oxygenase [Gammaproteobacteria bacterium]
MKKADTFEFYPVASMHGSLPMGGYQADTPIYAADTRNIMEPNLELPLCRVDLEVGDRLAFYIDNVITPAEADRIIALTEAMGYQDAAPGIVTPPGLRLNQSVHWLGSDLMFERLYSRFRHLLPQRLDGDALYDKLSQRLNMYRYDQNDVFNPHTDGDWPGFGLNDTRDQMLEWVGPRSKLTMLLYLNGHESGIEGGETKLFGPNQSFVSVAPKTGRALFFRHGQTLDSVMHEGTRIAGNVSKYVARINVLYH